MKGIAIQTILLLLVGTLVVGILVYATYKSTTGSPLSEYECRGRMITWCTGCRNVGWSGGSGMSSELSACAQKYWSISHADCNAESDCSAFIPSGGGGGGAITTTTSTLPSISCQAAGGIGCLNQQQCLNIGGSHCDAGYQCIILQCCCFP